MNTGEININDPAVKAAIERTNAMFHTTRAPKPVKVVVKKLPVFSNRESNKIYGNENSVAMYELRSGIRKHGDQPTTGKKFNKLVGIDIESIRNKIRRPPAVDTHDAYYAKDLFATHNSDDECIVLSADEFLTLNNKTNNLKTWKNYRSI